MLTMIAPIKGDGDYRDALAADQRWYTLPRLMGRNGALWLWGAWMTEQVALPSRDRRDSYETLGTIPHTGKAVHSPLPVDTRVLDLADAFANLAQARGEQAVAHPWHRHPWTASQMIVYLYYAVGYGLPLPVYDGDKERLGEARRRFGVNGRMGDGAVAECLRWLPEIQRSDNTEMWVYGRRRRAVARISQYLSTPRPQPRTDLPKALLWTEVEKQ